MNLDHDLSILFWLNKSKINKKGLAPIWVRITIDGQRAECSTSKFIPPEYWDPNKCLPRSDYFLAKSITTHIRNVEVELNKHYSILLVASGHVTAEQLKQNFTGSSAKNETGKSFLKVFEEFSLKLKEKAERKKMSVGRYKKFLILYEKCKRFLAREFKRSDIPLASLNITFIENFHCWLTDEVSHNTATDYCKKLKQVMRYAAKCNYILNNPFQYYKCTYKKTKRTFLTAAELQLLCNKLLPIKRLEEVRDCYAFCCYTGYAYVDAAALSPENVVMGIDGNYWIIRDRQKTETTENVPLLPLPLKIIEKYRDHPYCKAHNKLLPMNSSQCYNAYLKEVANLCGINKNLTSHTARHTFATTVTLSNGVPIETVSKLLGHTDIRTTQIYAKIVDTKISEDMNLLSKKIAAKESVNGNQKLQVSNLKKTA